MGNDKSGSAFPQLSQHAFGSQVSVLDAGLTKREWFATHAPVKPDWFKHAFGEPEPQEPVLPADLLKWRWLMSQLQDGLAKPDKLREQAQELQDKEKLADLERILAHIKATKEWAKECAAWESRSILAEDVAWRYHWADAMLRGNCRTWVDALYALRQAIAEEYTEAPPAHQELMRAISWKLTEAHKILSGETGPGTA